MDGSSEPTDRELINRANDGDATAFEALYERYRDYALGLAWRWTGDRHASLDIVQDAFIWLLEQFPGFDARASMKTILYRIVRNSAITRGRKRDVRERHMPTIAATALLQRRQSVGARPLSSDPAQRELLDALAAAIDQLSNIQREIVLLRFVDDLAPGEIAMALDLPLGTVKSRLHNAISALREDPALENVDLR